MAANDFCVDCGARSTGAAFCENCGRRQEVAAPPAAYSPAPPPVRRSGVGLMALVGALTGLLIAVVIGGGWWLWQQRGDDGTPATATSETPAPEETPEDDTSPDAEVEPTEETTTADAYECWDGSTAEDASSCGEPTGTEGLMWVFPDLATDSSCFQRPSDDLSVGAIDSWECPVDDYDTGYVRYTWWRSINEMFELYGTRYNSESDCSGDRAVWYGRGTPERTYDMSTAYCDYPFSFSIVSQTKAARGWILEGTTLRPATDFLG
jgi:hypothetical protein